ncbi:MAG: phospho-sugar mutase, partial [Clostridia bacterium]
TAPPAMLAGEAVCSTKDYAGGLNSLPKSDVLTYETASGLKAIVRPSGTEPKVKVYLSARGDSRKAAEEKLARMRAEIDGWMQAQ